MAVKRRKADGGMSGRNLSGKGNALQRAVSEGSDPNRAENRAEACRETIRNPQKALI